MSVIKMKSHSVIAYKKDVIASVINDENDTCSMLKLKILSTINLFDPKKNVQTSEHI